MKPFIAMLAALAIGVAVAQEPITLLCKGDAWNQFLIPRRESFPLETIVRLDVSTKKINFSDIGLGEMTANFSSDDTYFSASATAPPNRLDVRRVAVLINRVSGAASFVYWIGEIPDREKTLASFAGRCERASAKF